MGRWIRRLAMVGVALIAMAFLGLHVLAGQIPARLNQVLPNAAQVRPEMTTLALHWQLLIADLHADPLLWSRDLSLRSSVGHVDLPRLLAAGVGLQIFGAVTKTPWNMNLEQNPSDSDQILPLAIGAHWPVRSYFSLTERALHQAAQLRQLAQSSNGSLKIILTREQLQQFLLDREQSADQGKRAIGALLAIEGMHAMEGKLEHFDRLFDGGFRVMGLAHFFDNEVSGSAHGMEKGGLTGLGRMALARMEERGVTVDLAHASPRAFDEALALAKKPVMVSHTGVKGTCDSVRNLSDDQLRAVARNGGVVGIGFWNSAVCGEDARVIAEAILYAAKVAGEDHVGLGSDFDGAVTTPFDVTGLPQITQALRDRGLLEPTLRKIMGGNAVRVLRANLP